MAYERDLKIMYLVLILGLFMCLGGCRTHVNSGSLAPNSGGLSIEENDFPERLNGYMSAKEAFNYIFLFLNNDLKENLLLIKNYVQNIDENASGKSFAWEFYFQNNGGIGSSVFFITTVRIGPYLPGVSNFYSNQSLELFTPMVLDQWVLDSTDVYTALQKKSGLDSNFQHNLLLFELMMQEKILVWVIHPCESKNNCDYNKKAVINAKTGEWIE